MDETAGRNSVTSVESSEIPRCKIADTQFAGGRTLCIAPRL